MRRTTEADSKYDALEDMSVEELLTNINREDQTVAQVVQGCIPQITPLVEAIVERMRIGGRLFYIGSGTSGRLGILDASECPPTFGVPHEWVIGLIAGGDGAIRIAVESAEDDDAQAIQDLDKYDFADPDILVGITASGTTPYVIGGLKVARERGVKTGGVTCNPGSPLALTADFPVVAEVGPEFVTGSTRMKAGTAQKLILNMMSTSTMVRLGRVKGNKMVDMKLSNAKLVDRGTRYVASATGLDKAAAKALLLSAGSVRRAIEAHEKAQ